MYGLLSATLTAVYAGIVVGIGTLAGYARRPGADLAAAVTIALLFQPVRQRAQLVANRLVYGQRATPYQVLADFAQDMAGQLDADVALNRMASVLAGATGAVRVEVWIRVGAQLRPQVDLAARIRPRRGRPACQRLRSCRPSTPRHGRSRSGTPMSCSARSPCEKPRNEPVSAAEDRLLERTWPPRRAWFSATSG